jgi:hypothetical protein
VLAAVHRAACQLRLARSWHSLRHFPTPAQTGADLEYHAVSVYRFPRADDQSADSLTQRMQRVRAEAADIAQAHTADFRAMITETLTYADDIAGGGEAYHVGVRELARSLALDLRNTLLGLDVLRGRPPERAPAAARRAS